MSLPPSFWTGAGVDLAVLVALAALPRRSPAWGTGLSYAGGFAALVVTACSGWSTLPTVLAGLGGLAAVGAARVFGAAPRWTCAAVAVLLPAVLAADVWHYRTRVWEPWVTAVRTAQEAYPVRPRDEVLRQPPADHGTQPAEIAAERWPGFDRTDLSRFVGSESDDSWRALVTLAELPAVHTEFADRFASRPNFGRFRMPSPDFEGLAAGVEEIPTFPQPSPDGIAPDGTLVGARRPAGRGRRRAGEVARRPRRRLRQRPRVRAAGGCRKTSRSRVTGLSSGPRRTRTRTTPRSCSASCPHATQTPAGEGPLAPAWELRTVELIGLVQYDEPVAYTSPDLPRMGETATHHVRTLTDFERSALPRLAGGEWVVAAEHGDRLRAVGALPAAKACAACHGVEEGRLLGALSYDFARSNGDE